MEQLGFAMFLIAQATFAGGGVALVALASLPLFLSETPGRGRFAVLPLIWLLPLLLGGIFHEPQHGAKSADWLGWVALLLLPAFLVGVAWAGSNLRGGRVQAGVFTIANVPVAAMAAFVTGMAADGTWL